jgi:hypothetical protein
VDSVKSTATVAFNTQFGAPNAGLQPGEVIDALVLQILADGRARLSVANTIIDVLTQVPLTPGTTVRLAVKNTPTGIHLVIVDRGAHADGAPRAAGVSDTGARPAVARPSATNIAATIIAGRAAANEAVPLAPSEQVNVDPPHIPAAPTASAALAQAVRASAMRQNGLAPLFADVQAAMTSSLLPAPVRQVAAALLALRPTLDGEFKANDVKQALVRSGLFFEARVAATVLPTLRPTRDGKPDVEDAKQTSERARLFFEAPKAAASAKAASPPVAADDLKATLTVFRQVVKTWLAAEDTAAKPILDLPELLQSPSIAVGKPSPPSLAPTATPAAEIGAKPKPPGVAMTAPPPPYRGAPPAPQPPAVISIAPDASPHETAKQLLVETDAVLARQTLLQAASLPEHIDLSGAHIDPNAQRWAFEVPFVTPQGQTTIAQFEIARDGRNAPAEGVKPVWRVRFSLDVEPMGAVHSQISLVGSRAAVTLWAERPASAARLRATVADLSEALRQAALDPGDMLVCDGAPPRPREQTAGRFLDRAT